MSRLVLVSALVLGVAGLAQAGDNPEIAIALHVQQIFEECDSLFMPDCYHIETYHPFIMDPIYVYVLICGHGFEGDGFTGASYGVSWPEEWGPAWDWVSCADHTDGAIWEPGDYVTQTWDACQPPLNQPEVAAILMLYPMSPGEVWVTAHGVTGKAEVHDCYGGTDAVIPCHPAGYNRAGWLSVLGVGFGCNPCPCVFSDCIYDTPSGAGRDTWGAIKSLFR
jgi:hypothetical protein